MLTGNKRDFRDENRYVLGAITVNLCSDPLKKDWPLEKKTETPVKTSVFCGINPATVKDFANKSEIPNPFFTCKSNMFNSSNPNISVPEEQKSNTILSQPTTSLSSSSTSVFSSVQPSKNAIPPNNSTSSLFSSVPSGPSNSSGPNQSKSLFSSIPSTPSFGGSFASTDPSMPKSQNLPKNPQQSLFSNPSQSFGSSTSNNTGSVFGSNPGTTNSLFNSTSNNTGSLFGSNTGTPSSFSNSAPSSTSNNAGNLFGSSSGAFSSFSNSTPTNPQSFANTNNGATTGFSFNSPPQPTGPLFTNTNNFNTGFANPNPNPFIRGQPSLFHQQGATGAGLFGGNFVIPPFEEIPERGNVYPACITLTTGKEKVKFELVVNGTDTYFLSGKVLIANSRFFKEQAKENSEEIVTVNMDLPFPGQVYDILLWIFYRNDERLLRPVTTLKHLLELYAINKYFQISGKLKLKDILLSHLQSSPIVSSQLKFSSVLNKNYIDLEFLFDIFEAFAKNNVFGNLLLSNFVKTAMVLEWLGERECENTEEVEELMASEEFLSVGEILRKEKILPNTLCEYPVLAKKYPIGIKALSIQHLLIGISLL